MRRETKRSCFSADWMWPGAESNHRHADFQPVVGGSRGLVESRTGAVAERPRFQSPLIEPDMRISRIRLSDKTSCCRPRTGLGQGPQAHETQTSVEVLVREARVAIALHLVLGAQPPAQPTDRVSIQRSIALTDRP